MHTFKNKKRLTALVTLFMLTFVVGTAFALTSGTLTITGTAQVAPLDELYVVWLTADVLNEPDTDFSSVTMQNAGGRENQTLIWTIDFTDTLSPILGAAFDPDFPDFDVPTALLMGSVQNNALVPAVITQTGATWGVANADAELAANLGLVKTVQVNDGIIGTANPLAAGANDELVWVTVEWNPANFNAALLPPLGDAETSWTVNIQVTFNYAPIP